MFRLLHLSRPKTMKGDREVYVNLDFILYVLPGERETKVIMRDGDILLVKESPNFVMRGTDD